MYLNPNIQKLLQNYRSAFLQLGMEKYRDFREQQESTVLTDDDLMRLKHETLAPIRVMDELMPDEVVPINSQEMKLQIAQIYNDSGDLDSREVQGSF